MQPGDASENLNTLRDGTPALKCQSTATPRANQHMRENRHDNRLAVLPS